jgi:hypothetical protein
MGQEVRMWRNHLKKVLLTGAVGAMLTMGSGTSSEALTVPVRSAGSVAGPAPTEQAYYGYYYRRRYNPAGAFVAGAALGLIGAAAIASASSYPYYGYYPASYGYYTRAYYRPVYYARPYWGYRRVVYARPYWGYRRVVYARPYWGYRRVVYARPYWGYGGYRRVHWRRW